MGIFDKLKRLFIIGIIFGLLCSLTGCNKESSTSENSSGSSIDQTEILTKIFNDNQKHIQDLSSLLISVSLRDGEAINISLDENAKLTSHNNRVYRYKLQEGKLEGDFADQYHESLTNNSDAIEMLNELKSNGDIDNIFIEGNSDVTTISFYINKSAIPEICETNNNAGAEIIYCSNSDYANKHGYILITDNYYGYVYPRPE